MNRANKIQIIIAVATSLVALGVLVSGIFYLGSINTKIGNIEKNLNNHITELKAEQKELKEDVKRLDNKFDNKFDNLQNTLIRNKTDDSKK